VLLAAVLERVGFRVDRLLARVGADGDPIRGRTHMTLRVHIDGEAWLADAGFGSGLLAPLPFDGGAPRRQGGWTFTLAATGNGTWALRERQGEEWVTRYRFADERQYPADVVVANHFTSTFPRSPFVLRPVTVRKDEDTLRELVDDTFRVTRPDRSTEERVVGDDEVGDLLRDVFRLPLSPAELDRLLRARRALARARRDGGAAPAAPPTAA
jgi:N-hydroxyarylamine O-acetyltransferase